MATTGRTQSHLIGSKDTSIALNRVSRELVDEIQCVWILMAMIYVAAGHLVGSVTAAHVVTRFGVASHMQ